MDKNTTPLINKPSIDINGTCLQGYLNAEYSFLKERLGEPLKGHDKCTAQWHIEFQNKEVATVYDWKTSQTPKEKYHWHVGGKNKKVLKEVANLLEVPQM
jgi:hypothetical protein